MADISAFYTSVTCHAWNADKTMVALCPNNNEIHVVRVGKIADTTTWERLHVLKEHDQVVTSIDWAPRTNRLLSCSQDRNAYVWAYNEEEETWKPTLVLLRINRAATCCKWSPEENKFAVGSSSKVVCICYFEKENDWWVSKIIRKHKSTVLQVAWHPLDNNTLATASSDFKCRIFSTFIRGIDKGKGKFGEMISEYTAKAWVHAVAWSPSGNSIAFASHDSTLTFVTPGEAERVNTVSYTGLPYCAISFLSENAVVGGGHEFTPFVFQNKGGNWTMLGSIDKLETKAKKTTGNFDSAMKKFDNLVNIGATTDDRVLPSKHQNCINMIQVVSGTADKVSSFTTSGLDGRIVPWEVSAISQLFPGFAL